MFMLILVVNLIWFAITYGLVFTMGNLAYGVLTSIYAILMLAIFAFHTKRLNTTHEG